VSYRISSYSSNLAGNMSYRGAFYNSNGTDPTAMAWNWQQPDWPDLTYDPGALDPLEKQFLLRSGEFIGAYRHIGPDDQETLKIELISDEAVKTSEIEGEILNRASVQSSLRHQLGLGTEQPGVRPAERGISKMMVDLYRSFAAPLTDETMFDWHRMLLTGDRSIEVIGGYPIERKRKDYFAALERTNKDNEVTNWLTYFANTVLEAQDNTLKRVDFYVAKAKVYDRLRGRLNERQEKVIARMFREGIDGFKGGLSAEKLHQHQPDLAGDCDKRFAGPRREGRTHQDGRAAAHAIPLEFSRSK
jgi:Fic family protein